MAGTAIPDSAMPNRSLLVRTPLSPPRADPRRRTRSAIALLACLTAATPVAARPPKGANPELHDWFNGLRQPQTGGPCCSVADCRRTEARHGARGWEVLIDSRFGESDATWRPVPQARVLDQRNPTGEPVVCYIPALGIVCFVPPPET